MRFGRGLGVSGSRMGGDQAAGSTKVARRVCPAVDLVKAGGTSLRAPFAHGLCTRFITTWFDISK